ncbi:hypothetical protein F4777DRAFT_549670 [Nemania sp. FL0916]|nr:hypothetical protein F4777DRAFT_549670 [Nemania sp. FL0916]
MPTHRTKAGYRLLLLTVAAASVFSKPVPSPKSIVTRSADAIPTIPVSVPSVTELKGQSTPGPVEDEEAEGTELSHVPEFSEDEEEYDEWTELSHVPEFFENDEEYDDEAIPSPNKPPPEEDVSIMKGGGAAGQRGSGAPKPGGSPDSGVPNTGSPKADPPKSNPPKANPPKPNPPKTGSPGNTNNNNNNGRKSGGGGGKNGSGKGKDGGKKKQHPLADGDLVYSPTPKDQDGDPGVEYPIYLPFGGMIYSPWYYDDEDSAAAATARIGLRGVTRVVGVAAVTALVVWFV